MLKGIGLEEEEKKAQRLPLVGAVGRILPLHFGQCMLTDVQSTLWHTETVLCSQSFGNQPQSHLVALTVFVHAVNPRGGVNRGKTGTFASALISRSVVLNTSAETEAGALFCCSALE